jgi:hypothetical protein
MEKEVVRRTLTYCPACGRDTGPVREVRTETDEKVYLLTAPWCEGVEGFGRNGPRCKQLTDEELQLPNVLKRWTHIGEKDWDHIDPGIIPMLKEAHAMGLRTCFSCDGHGRQGYIMFYTPAEAQKYYDVLYARADFFQRLWLELQIHGHTYLPMSATIRIPSTMLQGTPKVRKAKSMLKHYVTYASPGLLFDNFEEREVPTRDPETALRNMPPNAFSFQFYSRTEKKVDGELLVGEEKDFSPTYYVGKVYTLDEVKKEFGNNDSYRILIQNMEGNDYQKVVLCRTGNWKPFIEDKTIVLPEAP